MRRDAPTEPTTPARGVLAAARRHPVVTGTLLACTVAGALLGPELLTPDWSLARRVAAGAVAGAGIGLLFTATKLIG